MDKRKNIVFVLTDQWRAQAFGYRGDPNVKTPNIDNLATESLNFENAISVCPVCTPQRASLLTGRYPTSTGMFMNDLYLPKEELTLGDIFKAEGYDTGYIGKWHLDGHGRDQYIPPERRQGFDYWKVLECTHNYNNSYYYDNNNDQKVLWDGYDAYAQTKDAINYINDHAQNDKPYFLFLGFGGPHFPHHSAPEELKELYPIDEIKLRPNVTKEFEESARQELQGYYGHCTAIDQCIGDLQKAIEAAGETENTIFVFTADHGDMMGSQGMKPWMKQVPWDESVNIPFLIKNPKLFGLEGKVNKTSLNTPDILPTLLDLVDIEIPTTIEGESMAKLMLNNEIDEDRASLYMAVAPFADVHPKPYRAIRSSKYTYVKGVEGTWLLYDNEKDPYQMNNLVDDPDVEDLKVKLDTELQQKLNANNDEFLDKDNSVKLWGYRVIGKSGCIPYNGENEVQSPAFKP
jgi:arylsulfatase A-like enzyme